MEGEKEPAVVLTYQIIVIFRIKNAVPNEIIPENHGVPVILKAKDSDDQHAADEKFIIIARSWMETLCGRKPGSVIDTCLVYDPQSKRREDLKKCLMAKDD